MACMKQTPRNPVLDRALTAMGIDVQEREYLQNRPLRRYQLEENNPANIYCTKPLNENQQQVVLKSCIDIVHDYWLYVRYEDINNQLKA